MSIPELLAGILATYRIARMIAYEDGPWDIFIHWRTWLADHTVPDSWVVRGFNCPLCLSWWCGFIVALALPAASLQAYLVQAIALSGGASWLVRVERQGDD